VPNERLIAGVSPLVDDGTEERQRFERLPVAGIEELRRLRVDVQIAAETRHVAERRGIAHAKFVSQPIDGGEAARRQLDPRVLLEQTKKS
jgi:hypothetical protein